MISVEDENMYPGRVDKTGLIADDDDSAFNPNTFMHFKLTPQGSSVTQADEDEIRLSDFLVEDVPLLISDNESDDEKRKIKEEDQLFQPSKAAEEVKRSMRPQQLITPQPTVILPDTTTRAPTAVATRAPPCSVVAPKSTPKQVQPPVDYDFSFERKQLMTIVVKYISTKITNSFPPDTPHKIKPNELPLDKFLLILVSRLQLNLPDFMRGVIYLFRYMDIIYLLRYLNQSNNFANYNEMEFGLKKLIVGCFKLVLIKKRKSKDIDWFASTQLPNGEVNKVVKTIVKRLNGKIQIKDIELVKLKSEIFRFVKMVTKRI